MSKTKNAMLNEVPMRRSGSPTLLTVPLIYRFYEPVLISSPA
jgi:cyanate lyase